MIQTLKKYPLAIIFFTVCVDMLGFGVLIPVLPLLLADPLSAYFILPQGWSLDSGYILLGFLTATYPLGQFFATPILGQLSDRYGRKKILTISLFGTCLSYVLFAIGIITRNIPLLFFSRFFDGITGGNISVAQAAIADITTPESRAKNFGLIGAAFGLGFILGPYIGGKLSDPSILPWFNAATPFWFAAILGFLNVLFIVFFFGETLKAPVRAKALEWGRSFMNIFHAFSYKDLRMLFSSIFLFQSGFTFFTTFFGVYLINTFAFTQGGIGDFFAYAGIWIAVTQIFITRRIAKRFSEQQVLNFSIMGVGVAVLAHFIPTQWWGLLFVTPFFAMLNGLAQANATSLVSRSAGSHQQGEVLGISASVQALAQALPPMVSGYVAAGVSASAPIVAAGMIIMLAGMVFILWYRTPAFPVEEAR